MKRDPIQGEFLGPIRTGSWDAIFELVFYFLGVRVRTFQRRTGKAFQKGVLIEVTGDSKKDFHLHAARKHPANVSHLHLHLFPVLSEFSANISGHVAHGHRRGRWRPLTRRGDTQQTWR